MALVRDVEWEACLLEPRSNTEVEKRFKKATGQPGALVSYFTTSDWIGDALIELSLQSFHRVHIEQDLRDMACMMVSQDNSCRYCFAATRAVLRVTGMSQKRISELESDLVTADIDEHLRGALEFSRRLAHSNPAPGAAERQEKNSARRVVRAWLVDIGFLHGGAGGGLGCRWPARRSAVTPAA